MSKSKFIILVIFIFIPISNFADISSDGTFEYYHNTGQRAFEDGNYNLAKSKLLLALDKWKSSDGILKKSEIYSTLGLISMAEQEFDKSIEYFHEFIKINPNNGMVHYHLALIYMHQNRNQDAIRELELSAKIEPNFYMTFHTLGDLYRKERKFEQAIIAHSRVTGLNPENDSAYIGLGEALRQLGKYDYAIEILKKGIEINGNNALGHYTLGLCHISKNEYQKAIDNFHNALAARVWIPDAFKVQLWTFLGQAYENSGQEEKAREAYQKAKILLNAIP